EQPSEKPNADKPAEEPVVKEEHKDAPNDAPEGEAGEKAKVQPAEEPARPRGRGGRGGPGGGGRGPQGVRAQSTNLSENRLAILFDAEKIGIKDAPGIVALSGLVEKNTITGTGELPDGKSFKWSAEKVPGENKPAAPEAKKEELAHAGDEHKDGDKEGEKEAEDEAAPKDIPEKLGLPFGAYAYDALPESKTVVVTNATIWTSGPQGIIENGWLVAIDGKIDSVGAGGAPRGVPDGATVIDAKGKHVSPGLIDCHSHTGISGGVNEGTHACTAEVRVADVINPDSVGWYRELAGGLTAANQLHGSANPIGGQNSVVKIRWGVENPDDMKLAGAIAGIKFALGENVKGSNNDTRNPPLRYPQTRMGVETFIRDRFDAARDYLAAWDKWNKLKDDERKSADFPRRDLELEALAEILQGQRLIHCHSYRQDEILMLCRVAHDFGFRIGTFQHVLEGYKVADAIHDNAIGGSTFSDWWAYKWEVYDAIPYNGAIMTAVGVPVSFNSDSDELARRLNSEAAKAVKYGGVAPAEALKFVTLNPAKQLKIDSRVGSLEAGKDADFVIWSGSPLSSLSRCEATYIDGREYFSLAKDTELRNRIASERRRLIQKVLADKSPSRGDGGEGRGEGGPGGPGGRRGPRDPNAPPPVEDTADSARGRFFAPAGDGADLDAIRERELAERLQNYFDWMTRNGLDPFRNSPGDCGCSLNCLLGQE
ncbi:MAG TPA: amidohydrolase, partial [Phycisphaerales bacterium]|nr:amidohydrolase [Phycisphaerales bacterium]